MRQLLIFILVLFLFSFQQYKLVKIKINKDISVKLPMDFTPVPLAEQASKYVSYRSPIAFFSNTSKDVDFSINNSLSRWRDTDIELMQSFYKSNISYLFDNAEYIREGIEVIDKRSFIYFEFTASIVKDESVLRNNNSENKYFYIQYTIKEGQVYIFSFSTQKQLQHVWAETAKQIMQSVKMK